MTVAEDNNLLLEELGSLKDDLVAIGERFKESAPAEIEEVVYEHVKRWKETDFLAEACKKGDILPDFCLPDENGNMVSSVDLRQRGPVVLVFFRGNWCPYCNATLRMIRKYTPHFKARGATIVAISPQTIEQSKQAVVEGGLNFPVLSDVGNIQSQAMKIAFEIEDEMKKMLNDVLGADFFQKYNGDMSYVLPVPAAYVVDADGIVSYSFLDLDYSKRAEPVEMMNALPALKRSKKQTLKMRIDIELAKLQDVVPETKMQKFFESVEATKNKRFELKAVQADSKAPDFRLEHSDGKVFDSRRLRREGPLVLVFHHGHTSPICMVQLQEMQKRLDKVNAIGANIVAISSARSGSSTSQIAAYSGAKFHLLVDREGEDSIAKKFGLKHELTKNGIGGSHILRNSFDVDTEEDVLAATYIIDRSGVVIFASVDADPTKRPEPTQVLRVLAEESARAAKSKIKVGPFSLRLGRRIAPLFTRRHM